MSKNNLNVIPALVRFMKLSAVILVTLLAWTATPAHWPHDGPTGRFNLLIVRADFEDAPGVLYTTTEFRDLWVPQIEQYFTEMSNDNIQLHVTVLDQVVTLGPRFRYHWLCHKFFPSGPLRAWECRSVTEAADLAQDANYIDELSAGLAPLGGSPADVFDGIMIVFGAPTDFAYGGALHLNSCGSGFRANSSNPTCVNKDDPRRRCEGNRYPGFYGFMTVSEDGDGDCTSSDPFADIGPALHEVGHSITSHNNSDNGGHPAGYGNKFELLDSCYPCETGIFTRVSPAVKGPGFKLYFPGWLDDSKITLFEPPTGGTEVLEPVELDPDLATSPMGLRVGAGDGTSYWVECRKLIGQWDGGKPIPDEGVVILHAVPGATEDPYETTFVSPVPGGSTGDAWEPGEVFVDLLSDIIISIGPDVGDGCTVTVDYGPLSLAGVPDIGMTPWLTPPNRTWETIDIWVDSSCNGYEDAGGVLRYGRDTSGDVIDNGDDACANEENRIYARVRNYGTGVAADVVVDFYVTNPLGVGIRGPDDWTKVGTADKALFPAELTSIPPGGVVEVWVPWRPMVESPPEGVLTFPFHSCLQVKMNTVAGERVVTNQDGDREQENIGHFEVRRTPLGSYEDIERFITLTNPDNETLMYQIRPTTDIPSGWEVDIGNGQSVFWLDATETVRIPVRIRVPDSEVIGRRVVVKVTGFKEERIYDDVTGELLHWSEHEVGGLMLAIRTVDWSTLDWTASSLPPNSCTPQTIVADGCLKPLMNGVPVAITYREPSGARTTNVTFTDPSGCFSDAYLPNGGGQILVSAFWQGDLTSSSVSEVRTVSAATTGDLDCDQIPDSSDNCDEISNPTQADTDGDGYGNECDCDKADPGAWDAPDEVSNLHFDNSTRIVWDSSALQAGTDTVYEIVRGAVADLPLGVNYDETCLVTQVDIPVFDDIQIPAPGEEYYYLARGMNGCDDGTLGSRSSGLERQSIATCPTCPHDKCDQGVMLDAACDDCVHNICDVDPYCCDTQWDSTCESEVRTVCGSLVCDESQGTCSHTLCTEGAALGNGCDSPPAGQSCVDQVCAADAFCCGTQWDALCVDQVETVCGNTCY